LGSQRHVVGQKRDSSCPGGGDAHEEAPSLERVRSANTISGGGDGILRLVGSGSGWRGKKRKGAISRSLTSFPKGQFTFAKRWRKKKSATSQKTPHTTPPTQKIRGNCAIFHKGAFILGPGRS